MIDNSRREKHPLPFKKINYALFGCGIVCLLLGYYLMSIGPWDSFLSLTLSPLILLVGYLVFLPIAIMYDPDNK